MKGLGLLLSVLFVALAVSGCTANRMTTQTLPKGVVLNKNVKIPNDTFIAIYIPADISNGRFYLEQAGFFVEPGRAMKDAVSAVMKTYFTEHAYFDRDSEQLYGLLLDLQPTWSFQYGQVEMTMQYVVRGEAGVELLKGEKKFKTSIGSLRDGNGFYNAALRSTQMLVIDVLNRLKPTSQVYAQVLRMKDVSPETLVDKEKPVRTGSAFFINATGQMLTAAHVLKDCAWAEVKQGTEQHSIRIQASSTLLDLTLGTIDKPSPDFLPLRNAGKVELGENVSMIGFPLQGVLAASSNLTRGNISSMQGLQGDVGTLQFSAPIQPGASGGPLVSDQGELIGVTLSSLHLANLGEKGILPQNVNFALQPIYVKKFLDKNAVVYSEYVEPKKGPTPTFQNAIPAVVQVACYQ